MDTSMNQMNTRRRWGIYHAEREFARETGDPCLGVVIARNKREAEWKAQRAGLSGPTGIWAHPLADAVGKNLKPEDGTTALAIPALDKFFE